MSLQEFSEVIVFIIQMIHTCLLQKMFRETEAHKVIKGLRDGRASAIAQCYGTWLA